MKVIQLNITGCENCPYLAKAAAGYSLCSNKEKYLNLDWRIKLPELNSTVITESCPIYNLARDIE